MFSLHILRDYISAGQNMLCTGLSLVHAVPKHIYAQWSGQK